MSNDGISSPMLGHLDAHRYKGRPNFYPNHVLDGAEASVPSSCSVNAENALRRLHMQLLSR